jgi:hypothetical protein
MARLDRQPRTADHPAGSSSYRAGVTVPDQEKRPPAEPPPVNTDAEGVHAEPKRTGHRLLDLSIAVSAILISLTSLAIAIHHGRVQQKLVAANSWPFLTSLTSNDFGDGRQTFSLMILNSGVGPAKLEKLVVRYDGKPVRGWVELLQACCGISRDFKLSEFQDIGFVSGGRAKGIIRANQHVLLLRLARLSERPQIWERFGASRLKLSFEACYCSILGECWESDLQTLNPKSVRQCEASADDYIEVGAGFDDSPVLPVIEGS